MYLKVLSFLEFSIWFSKKSRIQKRNKAALLQTRVGSTVIYLYYPFFSESKITKSFLGNCQILKIRIVFKNVLIDHCFRYIPAKKVFMSIFGPQLLPQFGPRGLAPF